MSASLLYLISLLLEFAAKLFELSAHFAIHDFAGEAETALRLLAHINGIRRVTTLRHRSILASDLDRNMTVAITGSPPRAWLT
jgi:hypothetical protein